MPIIKLNKNTLINILDEIDEKLISNKITDMSRWSIHHEIIFRYENKLYKAYYSTAATELQQEYPWEYEDVVECIEVIPIEKTIIIYEDKKN